jgi:plasmid stabilization system protein ParE
MELRRLSFTPEAIAEFEAAFSYFLEVSLELASAFEGEILRATHRLARDRDAGAHWRGSVWRLVLTGRFPYVIHFKSEPDRVQIVSVLHTSRDPTLMDGRGA